MGIDICQACSCCNHCDSRHVEGIGPDEARCPLDPEVTEAEIRARLEEQGLSKEDQEESLKSVTKFIELSMAKERLTNQVKALEGAIPDDLRADGWVVAVHNDYRQNDTPHTFWLLTHPDGRWIKGEGATDAEALTQCRTLASQKK